MEQRAKTNIILLMYNSYVQFLELNSVQRFLAETTDFHATHTYLRIIIRKLKEHLILFILFKGHFVIFIVIIIIMIIVITVIINDDSYSATCTTTAISTTCIAASLIVDNLKK